MWECEWGGGEGNGGGEEGYRERGGERYVVVIVYVWDDEYGEGWGRKVWGGRIGNGDVGDVVGGLIDVGRIDDGDDVVGREVGRVGDGFGVDVCVGRSVVLFGDDDGNVIDGNVGVCEVVGD